MNPKDASKEYDNSPTLSRPVSDDPNNETGVAENLDGLHRQLNNRQIQWIAIGGSIGTALFVSIGWGLIEGGPGSLFIAFTLYSLQLALVNSCMAELSIYMPVSGGFVRLAGHWVDDAFGFMAGWNFFLYEAILIPFEIAALNVVLTYWSDNIPIAAVCIACIVLYAIINLFAVRWYGESEFWLSSGKLILIFLMFGFTFVTMVGGNPQHDAYGFRYWNKPGAFAEYVTTGTLGRFEGFLGAFYQASFTIVGPEYISMVAGEAIYPTKTIKQAFKTVYWRFGVFFIVSSLCVGIVLPYNDPTLNGLLNGGDTGTAAASPYVIAMQNLGIKVLPDVTNALLVTSIFSAGNSYVYCASRSLHSLSLQGQAPKFLRKTTKGGVPIWCFCITMLFPFLSFLSVSGGASEALKWLANLTQASQLIDYIVMCTIYIFFHRACAAQNFDRRTLPYRGWYQPYVAYVGLVLMILTVATYGYTVFLPGWWDTGTFFTFYTMVFVCPVFFVGWKLVKKTKFVKPHEADLIWQRPAIEAYEATCEPPKGIWEDLAYFLSCGPIRKRKARKSEGAMA
ncbi:amino acid transporter-like protein [Aulographum hederae CBS 113979]|uniref:Amino acid transporter-like protein n=1 Tax=Aulographum hederae CBS 113979 TaxID=1176131 RepID=A0A6G1GRC9_9PEZI|nr:amino acid transporter-like protein [Aulographum hederae CBS 113979]